MTAVVQRDTNYCLFADWSDDDYPTSHMVSYVSYTYSQIYNKKIPISQLMMHDVAQCQNYKKAVDGSRQAAANIKPRRKPAGTSGTTAFPEGMEGEVSTAYSSQEWNIKRGHDSLTFILCNKFILSTHTYSVLYWFKKTCFIQMKTHYEAITRGFV